MNTDDRLPLFAFGTLRRGRVNHHCLDGRYARMVPARLPDYTNVSFLMVDKAPGSSVGGELFFLRPEVYTTTVAMCDRLEDIPPGTTRGVYYERRRVRVQTAEGDFDAWAYVRPEAEARAPKAQGAAKR